MALLSSEAFKSLSLIQEFVGDEASMALDRLREDSNTDLPFFSNELCGLAAQRFPNLSFSTLQLGTNAVVNTLLDKQGRDAIPQLPFVSLTGRILTDEGRRGLKYVDSPTKMFKGLLLAHNESLIPINTRDGGSYDLPRVRVSAVSTEIGGNLTRRNSRRFVIGNYVLPITETPERYAPWLTDKPKGSKSNIITPLWLSGSIPPQIKKALPKTTEPYTALGREYFRNPNKKPDLYRLSLELARLASNFHIDFKNLSDTTV